jgi:predicted Rossmann fold nucleotide-binding protein DprA/Smf involved in DNA uptake
MDELIEALTMINECLRPLTPETRKRVLTLLQDVGAAGEQKSGPPPNEHGAATKEVLDALGEDGARVADVAEALGITAATASQRCRKAERLGVAKATKRGFYVAVK